MTGPTTTAGPPPRITAKPRAWTRISAYYAGARTACLNAASDLFGAASREYAAVQNAFHGINVGAAAPTPTALGITTQPASQTANVGTGVTFTVTVTGGTAPYAYQWYRNDAAVGGATSAGYAFTAAAADNGATFYAKVSDSAGAFVAIATATLTVSSAPPSGSELLVNGGFESGGTGWWGSTSSIGTFWQQPAFEGARNLWLGRSSRASYEYLTQYVSVPATATSATLSCYLHIDTAERTAVPADTLYVWVLNSSGAIVQTLGQFTNLNAAPGYQRLSFDLGAYRGQSIYVYFYALQNGIAPTSFAIDKVSLTAR